MHVYICICMYFMHCRHEEGRRDLGGMIKHRESVCMYVYMHVCIYERLQGTELYQCMSMCGEAKLCKCIHTCTNICTYAETDCVLICMYVCMYVCTSICTYTETDSVLICMYVYMYVCIHVCRMHLHIPRRSTLRRNVQLRQG